MCKNNKNILTAGTNMLLVFSILTAVFVTGTAQAEIYFSAKIAGPVVNVFSVNEQGVVNKITDNKRWRDLEHNVSVNGLVSFSSNRKESDKILRKRQAEDYNIYIVDPATKQLSQISKQLAQEQQPKFSPSGNQLAFIRVDKKQQSLVIYDLATKKEKILSTAEVIYDYSWSPKNDKIAFANKTQNSANLVMVDIKTLASEVLVSTAVIKDNNKLTQLFVAPSWSPNGKHLAYIAHPLKKQANRTLNIYQLTEHKSKLISAKNIQVQAPLTWSKNSKTLLYSALVNYRQFYDETIHKKVYLGGMHIFSSDLQGKSRQITKGDHLFKQPIFSPDESQVAYLYADKLNARTLELHNMNLDGSNQKTLSKSIAQNAKIQWQ